MIRAVALDIDGTLTNAEGSVGPEGIDAVRRAQAAGMSIMLVSARPPQGVDSIARQLNGPVYRICYLGALIQSPSCDVISRRTISRAAAEDIAAFADAAHISLTVAIDDIEYHSQNKRRAAMTPVISASSAQGVIVTMGEPTIIAVEGHDQSKAIAGYCRRYHAHSVTMACQYFPDGSYQSALLVDYSVDKGRAVAIVCRELLVTLQDTIAIGDSESDISMFEQAGISVSVGTTDPNTNARATHVAPYTNGRGVAWALEHVLTC